MIIFGIWWWGSAGGVCVCIREGVGGSRLDRVLPCSDTCLRFRGFLFYARPDQCHLTQSEWLSSSLCLSVPENVSFNKLLPVVCDDMISAGRVCCSIMQLCFVIWVACEHTQTKS